MQTPAYQPVKDVPVAPGKFPAIELRPHFGYRLSIFIPVKVEVLFILLFKNFHTNMKSQEVIFKQPEIFRITKKILRKGDLYKWNTYANLLQVKFRIKRT